MDTTLDTAPSPSRLPELDLYRIGGVAGIVAGVLAIVANALHPRLGPGDLGDNEAFLEMVAGSSLWRIDHLAIIVTVLVGLLAFVGLSRSITDFPAASWARVGLASALATGAVAAVSFSIDGMVMAGVADDWANATGEGRAAVLERMATIEYFDIALFALAIIGLFGATQVLYGLALWQSELYPNWVGAVALVAGIVGFLSGAWMWLSGEIGVGNFLILFTLTSGLFAVWLLGASLRLLRLAQATPDTATLAS